MSSGFCLPTSGAAGEALSSSGDTSSLMLSPAKHRANFPMAPGMTQSHYDQEKRQSSYKRCSLRSCQADSVIAGCCLRSCCSAAVLKVAIYNVQDCLDKFMLKALNIRTASSRSLASFYRSAILQAVDRDYPDTQLTGMSTFPASYPLPV